MSNFIHGEIASDLILLLTLWLMKHPIGAVSFEADIHLPEDAANWRRPDVVLALHAQGAFDRTTAVPFMPALIIEIKSPGDTYTLMRQEALYYISRGTRWVWLVFPERETVEVYGADESLTSLHGDAALTAEDILPELRLPLSEVFAALRR